MVLRVQRTEAGQRRRQHATKQFCLADAAKCLLVQGYSSMLLRQSTVSEPLSVTGLSDVDNRGQLLL